MPTTISADNGSISGSAGYKVTPDSSGVLTLQTGANTDALTIDASQNATFVGNVSGVIKSGTAVTASGTSVNFTNIPNTAKRITVVINGLSFAAAGTATIQIGSGSLTVTGYTSNTATLSGAATNVSSQTNGFGIINLAAAANNANCVFVICNITGNTWSFSGQLYKLGDAAAVTGNGFIALSGVLDRLSLVATTSTFDAGTINILWE